MSIREQRFAGLNQEIENLDIKEGEVENNLFSQEMESSWGNLGGGQYRARRDRQELKGEPRIETEQMLSNVWGKERTWQQDVHTLPYVGMSEKIQSHHLSAPPSRSPFSFLMSNQLTAPKSEMNALMASGSPPSPYKRYSSGATNTITPSPWLRSSLLTLGREMDNRLTGSLKEQAVRENSIT